MRLPLLATSLVFVFLAAPGLSLCLAQADQATNPDSKKEALRRLYLRLQEESLRRTEKQLDEPAVESALFQMEMPLEKFLAALDKHLAKQNKVTLRLDEEALGDKLAGVAATAMVLPPFPVKVSPRRVLQTIIAKCRTRLDYRLEPGTAILTTPQRALSTVVYDIRDLVEKPGAFLMSVSSGRAFRKSRHGRRGRPC